MRVKLLAKLSTIAAIGVGTWLATSAILVRVKRVRAAPFQALGPPVGKTATIKGPDPRVGTPRQPGRSTITSHSMQVPDVEVQRNGIRVQDYAVLYETRPNMRYVWSVHIYKKDNNETPVFVKNYFNQVFAPTPGVVAKPTFDDLVRPALPRGMYVLHVGIYILPPGPKLEVLNTLASARRFVGPAASLDVEIR